MKHDIINRVIYKEGYVSYLEIGYGRGFNFKNIKIGKKIAVDPVLHHARPNVKKMRSDQFFKNNVETFDIIFIDGLHHADQVRRDLNNASKVLSEQGCIVLHDTYPPSKAAQDVPRSQSQWTGDVWRAVKGLFDKYDLDKYTVKADYGLTFIFPKGEIFEGEYEDMKTTYEEFAGNINEILYID